MHIQLDIRKSRKENNLWFPFLPPPPLPIAIKRLFEDEIVVVVVLFVVLFLAFVVSCSYLLFPRSKNEKLLTTYLIPSPARCAKT